MTNHEVDRDKFKWLRWFSGILVGLFLLFLWLSSGCFFQQGFQGLAVVLGTVTCFTYVFLAFGAFLIGLLPTLVGIDYAKSVKQGGAFFTVVLVIYLAGLVYGLIKLF